MLRLFLSQFTCFCSVFRKNKYVTRNRHQNTLRFTSAVQCHFWPFSWSKIDWCFYTHRALSFADMFKVICGNRKGHLFQCCRSFPDYMSPTILIKKWCVHCRKFSEMLRSVMHYLPSGTIWEMLCLNCSHFVSVEKFCRIVI